MNTLVASSLQDKLSRRIPDGLSVYLDFIRLGASIVVLLTHLWPLLFPHRPLPWPGHSAVVVFFVLSGYVISHSARPDLGLRGFALHRMARIYPVILAATALSVVIAQFVPVNVMNYGSSRDSDWMDIGLNLVFLGQSWMDVPIPYVGTVWSLDYEIWYYILFGLWCYYPSRILLVCAALLAGPKILLLLPVWMLGAGLHRLSASYAVPRASLLFLISAVAALLFVLSGAGVQLREALRLQIPEVINLAKGSNQFVGDFILGLIVAVNFLAAGSLRMELLLKFRGVIRYLSGFTFSLYIFHLPLAVLIWNGFQIRSPAAFCAILLAGVWILGTLTEQRNQQYRALLDRLIPNSGRNAESGVKAAGMSNG